MRIAKLAVVALVASTILGAAARWVAVGVADSRAAAAMLQQEREATVRDRLQRAIDTSRSLAAKGQRITDGSLDRIGPTPCDDDWRGAPLLFPRVEDVDAYSQDRPWALYYNGQWPLLGLSRSQLRDIGRWPTQADGPELRRLLDDKAPAMRCVAAEALATLHQVEDVERIARLLKDDAEGLPALGWNWQMNALPVSPELYTAGGLMHMRSWHNRTVAATAHLALRLMTDEDLTAQNFDKWWERNRGGRTCVWYWEQRLTRELAAAEAQTQAAFREDNPNYPQKFAEARQDRLVLMTLMAERDRIIAEQQQERFDAVRSAVAAELAQLPAEFEAKVRLAAINRHYRVCGVRGEEPLMGPFVCPRIGPDRLLDLLDNKNGMSKEWGASRYLVLTQIAARAELFFTREHISRLTAIMGRHRGEPGGDRGVSFIVGISHLLPSAGLSGLDDPDTRDGLLRSEARARSTVEGRGPVLAELVRVGLPANWDFLKKEFFAETGSWRMADVRDSVLGAFRKSPVTPSSRDALLDLVLDERFAPLWTERDRGMGYGMYRKGAMLAVNTHAGKELLTDQDRSALADRDKSKKALAEVLRKVATLRQAK